MRVDNIISKVDEAWQNASSGWNDNVSQRFYDVVVQGLNNILIKIKTVNSALESATDNALKALKEFER